MQDWRPLFQRFIFELRISSKEINTGTDARGARLMLWDSQQRFLDMVIDGLRDGVHDFLCLKSRQLGITTVSLALDLFWLAVHPGMIGALVCDTDTNRDAFREILRRYVNSFPKGFMGKTLSLAKGGDNRSYMKFVNGSRLDFLVAGTTKRVAWGESRGYALGHCTEVASYGSPEGIASFREGLAEANPDRLFMWESPLALDTALATPSGWTTMGEVKDDDWLFDERGNPCRVVGTSPVFLNKKCYRVEFSNGDHIVADADHLWRVVERRWATNQQWRVRDLPTWALRPESHRICMAEPLQLSDTDLPIDPYLLGAWLGDGRTAEVRLCSGDDDIDEFRELLQERGCILGPVTRCGDRIGEFVVLGHRSRFTRLGLLGNKHIPPQYLRASEAQRRLLLAGLMDTDGSIEKTKFACNFTSTRPALIDGVSELLASLGIKFVASQNSEEGRVRTFPTGNTSVCQASTRLRFHEWPSRDVFRLRRKRAIHNTDRDHVFRKSKYLKVTSITEVASVPVKCVAVDCPSHLFLAGRTMIPTHNTAKGFNHWRDMWNEYGRDEHTKQRMFVGWWAKGLNSIPVGDRRYAAYGVEVPDEEERELIAKVREDYGWTVTQSQLAWYRWRASDESTSAEALHQNQPWYAEQAFVLSGHSFFQIRRLQNEFDAITNADPPVEFEGFRFWLGNDFFASRMEKIYTMARLDEVELRVWEQPVREGTYVIGCDPAMGRSDNADRHAISVWRCYADRLVQVAEYADNRVETRQCAWVLAYLCGAYRNCMINLEITGGYGHTVMTELDNIRNQLRSEAYAQKVADFGWTDFLQNARWYLYHKPDSPGAGYVYNWNSTFDAKNRMLSGFRDAHVTEALLIRSLGLINEMCIVVQDDGSIGAPGKQKDDRVFAAGLACEAWNRWFRPQMIAEGYMWEIVSAREAGEISFGANIVSRLVQNTLKQINDEAEEATQDPQRIFLVDRGLIL